VYKVTVTAYYVLIRARGVRAGRRTAMRKPIINDNGTIHRYNVNEAFTEGCVRAGDFVAFSHEGETIVGRVSYVDHSSVEVVDMDGDKAFYRVGLIEGDVMLLGRLAR